MTRFARAVPALALLLALVTCACTTLTSPSRRGVLPKGAIWFDYAAERRGAVMVPASDHFVLCAEPAPDVALAHAVDALASVKIPEGAEASVKATLSNNVIQLAGRTQTILFLREAMYRLCEQSMNGNLSATDVKELYGKVVEAAVAFANAASAHEAAEALRVAPDESTRKMIEEFFKKPAPSPPSIIAPDTVTR